MRARRRTRQMIGAIAASGALLGTAAVVIATGSGPTATTESSPATRPAVADPPTTPTADPPPDDTTDTPPDDTTDTPPDGTTDTPPDVGAASADAGGDEMPTSDADPLDGSNGASDNTVESNRDDSVPKFVDEEPVEGVPGEITGTDEPTEPPSPDQIVMASTHLAAVPSAPTPPAPETPKPPIDLLAGDATPPAPPPGDSPVAASDFQVNPDAGVNELAGNATGCALECVSKAILTFNTSSPNVALHVETTLPVRTDVSLTESGTGDELLFTSNGFKTSWTTNLAELDEATEYDLVLEAFDKDGQKRVYTHTFTTRTPLELPDQFSDELLGCAGPCITQAVVGPGDVPEEVTISVNTNTLASITVWVSQDEPGWIDDAPILPAEAIVWDLASIRTDWSFQKNYLDLETNYHIVVKAYDGHGTQYQVGEFRTSDEPPTDVRVTFHQAYVRWDGDPHWGALDDGEISLGWGVWEGPPGEGDTIGQRSEQKMNGGTTVRLDQNNVVWRSLHEGQAFPALGVTVKERDPKRHGDFGHEFPHLASEPWVNHPSTFNVAYGPPMTVEEMRELETCGEMGLDYVAADDYCVRLEMLDPGNDYARVSTIVSYHIDT